MAIQRQGTRKGVSFAKRDDGFKRTFVKRGDGAAKAEQGDTVTVSYRGVLESDGTQFDAAKSFTFTLSAGEVIKGWDRGIMGLVVGDKVQLVVPPALAYGKRGSPPEIPPSATLLFDVTLRKIK